jgi:hypothetical protein
MPVYLSIQRPLRLSFDPYDEETWAEGIERAKDKGYDGIDYPNAVEGGESWVAFSPTQIKSAIGNRGTFEPEDPNIMHNPRRPKSPSASAPVVLYHGTFNDFVPSILQRQCDLATDVACCSCYCYFGHQYLYSLVCLR